MRMLISLLCGIGVAFIASFALQALTPLGSAELLGCSLAIAAIAGSCAHSNRSVRKASVRMRILVRRAVSMNTGAIQAVSRQMGFVTLGSVKSAGRRRREPRLPAPNTAALAPVANPANFRVPSERRPLSASVRAIFDRSNPMWISYALITCWAVYEVLGTATIGRTPIQIAADGASSVVGEAMASTTSAIETTSSALRVLGAAAVDTDAGAAGPAAMLRATADSSPMRSVVAVGHPAPLVVTRVSNTDCKGPFYGCGGSVLEWFMSDSHAAF